MTRTHVGHGVVQHQVDVGLKSLRSRVGSRVDLLLNLLQTLQEVRGISLLPISKYDEETNDGITDKDVVVGVVSLRRQLIKEL